eukprot:g3857.t1
MKKSNPLYLIVILGAVIASIWMTSSADEQKSPGNKRKIVFIAGKPSHGPGAHEHRAGSMLLADHLTKSQLGFETTVVENGWPRDESVLDDADAIVVYADGGKKHPSFQHIDKLRALAAKGIGIAHIHYAVEIDKGAPGDAFLDTVGGYFEAGWSVNPHWEPSFTMPDHPIANGIEDYSILDEWYYHMRFRENMDGITPILTALPPAETLSRKDGPHSGNPHVRREVLEEKKPQHVMWAYQRPADLGGGRAFGFTGGHFHQNWQNDNQRRIVLNAIAWISGADVPEEGVPIAILHSNDIYPTNADATLPFKQSNDLFYLTGVAQEETILLLFPDAHEPSDREILFLRETNPTIAVWEGAKLSKQQATERTGITNIQWTSAFEATLDRLVPQVENIYLPTNEHPRADCSVETLNDRFIRKCKDRFPLHQYRRLAPFLHKLRAIKSAEEIRFTEHACRITEAGFRRILPIVADGVGEWEIEAEFIHEFIRSGSKGFAYHPIIAGGANTCVLHYTANDQRLRDGDLLLLDVAAEYAGWNSDMTRTIPVSGTFTPRQREVYEAVLRVMRFANGILRPGILLADYQKAVHHRMEKELVALKLFTSEEAAAQPESKPLVKKYFMHGTSHHLGLDVHDVSPPNEPVAPGMVFTIEPGIYIPEENIGIRLENNYLIGETENLDLMAGIPIEPDEIESLMKS